MSIFRQYLGDGLALKTAENETDIDRVAEFDAKVFDKEEIGELCRKLFLYHPYTKPEYLIFVENDKTGEIVSSICLIPWKWKYDSIELDVGEMGIVGTLEPYRCRGLIRAQSNYLKKLIREGNYDISIIQGIPYFYRQFGYEYAIPLERSCIIQMNQIPDLTEGEKSNLRCRPETPDDIKIMESLYNESVKDLSIHAQRDSSIWRYLLDHSPSTVVSCERWIVEDSESNVKGYFSIQKYPFGDGLSVNETSKFDYEISITVLRHLKRLAIERNKPNIRLNLANNNILLKVAKYYGAQDLGSYAWQICIPDRAKFLRKISPVLEKRLIGTPFEGLTEEIRISFYEEKVSLNFENGNLLEVKSFGLSSNWWEPINIPPRASIQLFMGYRNYKELRESFHDISAQPKQSYLLDILFPKVESYIYSIY